MCKKFVGALILFYCLYDVKSTPQCDRILRKKGYRGVIEVAKGALNSTKMSTTNPLCRFGEKFSNELYTDKEAWLCWKYIVKLMDDNINLYNASIEKCNITHRYKDINCGSPDRFQLCIGDRAPVTLEGLANGESMDQKACDKCRELPNILSCGQKGKFYTDCPATTRKLLRLTFIIRSCVKCQSLRDSQRRANESKMYDGKNIRKLCHKILSRKGYTGIIELAKATMFTSIWLCSFGKKFSRELFTDPEAWLCLRDIQHLMKNNMVLYNHSIKKCNITNRWQAIMCLPHSTFDSCIRGTMIETLEGLANGKPDHRKSCQMCSEAVNLKLCAKNLDQYRVTCPAITRVVLNMNFALKYCRICSPNFDSAYLPPAIKIPKYVFEYDNVEFMCSINSSEGVKLALKFKEITWRTLVLTSINDGSHNVTGKSLDLEFTVDTKKSSRLKLYAAIKTGVGCVHTGLYSCHAVYMGKSSSRNKKWVYGLRWQRNSTPRKMEVIRKMGRPSLRLVNKTCNKTTTNCQDCKGGKHRRRGGDRINVTCSIKVAFPVNSMHTFKWYAAIDGGDFMEINSGVYGAAIYDVPRKFIDGTCSPLKQKTTTLRFITPVTGKVLSLKCVLVFKAEDVVKKFRASIDICLQGKKPEQHHKYKAAVAYGNKVSVNIIAGVLSGVVVLLTLAGVVYYYEFKHRRANKELEVIEEHLDIVGDSISTSCSNSSFTSRNKRHPDEPRDKESVREKISKRRGSMRSQRC